MDTTAILGLVGALVAAIIGAVGTAVVSRGSARRAAEAAEMLRAEAAREARREREEGETRRLVEVIADGLSRGVQLDRQASFLLQDVEAGRSMDVDRFNEIQEGVDQLISIVRNVVAIGDVPLTPAPPPAIEPSAPLTDLTSSAIALRQALIDVTAGTVPPQRLREEVAVFQSAVLTITGHLSRFQSRLVRVTFTIGFMTRPPSAPFARRLALLGWPMAIFLLIAAAFLGLVLYLLWPH
ncbi:hypothetical protein [Streptomyces sp. NPDC096339]|uniref:hypothetical protein n=1 Tax=Streptomyces sp. NPDC096339 TaxID=3366086 RepID=UPI003809C474